MDEKILLILISRLLESSRKEGRPIDQESLMSSLGGVLKAIETIKPLTPAQRHAITTERHIDDVCKERDRMARELKEAHEAHAVAIRELRRELTLIIDSHRDRLDWFEPHYEGLKRDYDTIRSLNFPSLFMITVGGLLIGSASFLPGSAPRFSALAAGAVATVYGLWTQGLVVSKSPTSIDRPAPGAVRRHGD